MIKRIFKYTIPINDNFTLELPIGAEILTVDTQFKQPQLWALVDPDAEKEIRHFRFAGTGHSIHYDMGSEYKYIGTFQMNNGNLIFHIFEKIGT